MISLLKRAFTLAALLLAPLWAQAAVVTLSGCASCNGASYQLFYLGAAEPEAVADPLHETYRITLRVIPGDVSTVVPTAVAIDAAALKVSGSVYAAQLLDAPGGADQWALVPGGIGASGCSGTGSGFTCADWQGAGVGSPLVDVLDFMFELTVNNGQLFTALNQAHVKARFVDAQGNKVGALLSNAINLSTIEPTGPNDPEPTPAQVPAPAGWSLLLLGGLAAAAQRSKRRA